VIETALAMAGGSDPQAGGGSAMSMFLPFILMFAVFYFLLIRPQQKKQKLHQAMLEAIKKGDEVMTSSGIFGRVAGVDDKIVTLEVAKDLRIRVAKSHIGGKVGSAETPPADKDK